MFLHGNLVHVDSMSLKSTRDARMVLVNWKEWFKDWLTGVRVIAYEDAKPRNHRHALLYYGMITIMELEAYKNDIETIPVHYGRAKLVTGAGNASKDDMLSWAVEACPHLEIRNHDEADAVAIGMAALEMRRGQDAE